MRPTNGFDRWKKRLNGLSDDVRRTAYQLHPSTLEHLGLADALETYCSEFSAQEGIKVGLQLRKMPGAIPKNLALCLYRVAQEALRSVAKHSGAKRAIPGGHSWRELINEMLKMEAPPPLILADRPADDRFWVEALNVGVCDLLAKPFRSKDVLRAVTLACRRHEHRSGLLGNRKESVSRDSIEAA